MLKKMWEDIILSIGEAVVSAVGSGWLEKKKREKFANRINTIIEERMLQFADTSLDCNEFYEFVNSRKFKELIRNFFCSTKDGKSNSEYMETIEQYLYDECPGIKHTETRTFIHELQVLYLDFLHKIIEDSPEMSASFQLLTLSHRDILSKMLESEENIMKYFKSLSNTEMKIDDETINSYHDVCEKEFGTIRFTGIAGAENKKSQTIEKFYVKNTFSLYPTKELVNIYKYSIDEIESIQLEDFFDYGSKIVLIGAAGLGKSTTLNYIFCKYEEMYKAFALKIKIDLKEYAHDIGEEKKDLLWCITSEFRKKIKRAKISFDDTEKLLTTYLEDGMCLIILDALDEIPTQKIRNKVRDEIGNFCEIYYLNRYIISTREAGYLKNRFDDSFLHIKINDFDGKQIQQYSKNWYCSYYEQKDFKEFWKKFSKEVERARCQSLIRNPIVLILALIIFDIEKNLPNKRVEFYKKCIETFLTVREDRKAAYILSEKTKNILGMDSVVPKIAHYKFLKISENVGYRFSYDELKESVFQAIEVEDRINWSDSVKQYSEYLVERTELIRETDEDTLDFAHKTFYEYFLAVYFTKEMENAKLLELLNDWIGDSNYDELARLIVEVIIQNDEPRQHKMVMDYLFEQLIVKEESERISNKLDVFIILADLYNHNMLQPKFHSKYNRVILYNPHYVEQANRVVRHNGRYSPVSVKYESKVIADMYCNDVLNEGKFADTLDSLFYLDNEYKTQVCDNLKEDYLSHIVNIFSLVKGINWRNSQKENTKNLNRKKLFESERKYFTNEGVEYTLRYPQVYISTIDMMVLLGDFSNIEVLFEYTFSGNRYFIEYTEPTILLGLVEKAKNDEKILLLLLIAMVECTRHGTNVLFGFLLDYRRYRDENVERFNNIQEITVWLWNLFNQSDTYLEFRDTIMQSNLYMNKYDVIYQQIYDDYRRYEKDRKDSRVEHFFKEKKEREN